VATEAEWLSLLREVEWVIDHIPVAGPVLQRVIADVVGVEVQTSITGPDGQERRLATRHAPITDVGCAFPHIGSGPPRS
jgi:hypothetical protein